VSSIIVRDGYERMGDRFESWAAQIRDDPRDEWRADLCSRLAAGARVLELGCGRGRDTCVLAERFAVTAVDCSPKMLEHARRKAPRATFLNSDFTSLDLDDDSFDAVASFYVFNHVPRGQLAPLLRAIHDWLVPGGLLLTAFGTSDTEAWTGEWLGVPMFFSSFPPERNSQLAREAGFDILRDELVTFTEPEGEATFQWILARSI